jgi:hypothetical protein
MLFLGFLECKVCGYFCGLAGFFVVWVCRLVCLWVLSLRSISEASVAFAALPRRLARCRFICVPQ